MKWQMIAVVLCATLVDAAQENAAKKTPEATTASPSVANRDKQAFYILRNHPPSWYLILCVLAFASTGATFAISYGNIKKHITQSRQIGYGDDHMIPGAYGPRASRIINLLILPPCFCVTALVQIILPTVEPLMSLARTVQLSFAVMRLLELIFVFLGGPDVVEEMLPKKPTKMYNAPPFCFCICKKVPDAEDVKHFCLGIRQFGIVAPVIGVVQVCLSLSGDNTVGSFVKFITLAMTATTMLGMWSFKCLYNLLGNIMKQILPSHSPKQMELFLLLQVISVKLVGMVLSLVLKDGYSKGDLTIDKATLGVIITGAYLTVVELALTKFGMAAFPANSEMYPAPDYQRGCPLDMCSQVQLEGGHTYAWQALAPFEHAQIQYSHEANDSEDDEDRSSEDE